MRSAGGSPSTTILPLSVTPLSTVSEPPMMSSSPLGPMTKDPMTMLGLLNVTVPMGIWTMSFGAPGEVPGVQFGPESQTPFPPVQMKMFDGPLVGPFVGAIGAGLFGLGQNWFGISGNPPGNGG